MTFSEDKIIKLNNKLSTPQKIVIVAHKSPDGDSIGSTLGLFHYFTKKGYDVSICHPDPAPEFLLWLDGTDSIINYVNAPEDVKQIINEATIIFCLDFNAMHRTGKEMEKILLESDAYKVMIDHHLDPADEFDLTFSETASCSTAQLIYDLIIAFDDKKLLDSKIGTPLYCGIMTDSGSFRYPSTTAHTHEVVGTLINAGVDNSYVHESVYDTNTLERLKLRGYAINKKLEILLEEQTAIMSLSEDELHKFNYENGFTEGLVNVGLSIKGITKSVFLKEQNGLIKISFRSKGKDNPVNEMANKYFSGGGHANASGGKWDGSLKEAIKELKRVLPQFC